MAPEDAGVAEDDCEVEEDDGVQEHLDQVLLNPPQPAASVRSERGEYVELAGAVARV